MPVLFCILRPEISVNGRVISELGVSPSLDGLTTSVVTVAACVTAIPSMVAETVFVPATVDRRVPVATPLALVVLVG